MTNWANDCKLRYITSHEKANINWLFLIKVKQYFKREKSTHKNNAYFDPTHSWCRSVFLFSWFNRSSYQLQKFYRLWVFLIIDRFCSFNSIHDYFYSRRYFVAKNRLLTCYASRFAANRLASKSQKLTTVCRPRYWARNRAWHHVTRCRFFVQQLKSALQGGLTM